MSTTTGVQRLDSQSIVVDGVLVACRTPEAEGQIRRMTKQRRAGFLEMYRLAGGRLEEDA